MELRETITSYLKESGSPLTLVEGTNDAVAYAGLKVEHQTELDLKLKGALSPEGRDAILSTAPSFDDFVKRYADKYLANQLVQNILRNGGKQQFVTTLTAVADIDKQVKTPVLASTVPAKSDTSSKKPEGFFSGLFSFFRPKA
jgi:hypothetical protein